jgi:phytoene synthase
MDGYAIAREITKKHAKTFYFASSYLPPKVQKAAYAVYAICRLTDDSIDLQQNPLQHLNEMKKNIEIAYGTPKAQDPLIAVFQETVQKYDIPKVYFDELIKGIAMDTVKNRYANFDELYDYCYKIAGVVGLIMLKVFGTKTDAAQQYAINLGIAMQLTNILRDIKEDYIRGKIYLPQEEMEQFGVTEEYIAAGKVNSKTIALLQFQMRRAQNYYMRAERGFSMISNVQSRFVARSMSHMYEGILTAIERNNYNVFKWHANVSIWGKIGRSLQVLSLRD